MEGCDATFCFVDLILNDKIVGINDSSTLYFDEYRAEILKHKNEKINVNIYNDGNTQI